MTKQEIQELINSSMFVSLGYNDEFGCPNIKRVYCTWHKGLGTHLISTNTSSMHVQALLRNDNACLYFHNDEKFMGVCFKGKVVVHLDRKYKEMVWVEGDEAYYPNGIEDEDYCILEFIAENGRYYRFDGIGDISADEIREYDEGSEFEDFFAALKAK